MFLFTSFNVPSRKFKSLCVTCTVGLDYILNRQDWACLLPIHETSDKDHGGFEYHLSSKAGIHVKILLISLIHPFLNFILLTLFEHLLCARDGMQHSQCPLRAYTVTMDKDGRVSLQPTALPGHQE